MPTTIYKGHVFDLVYKKMRLKGRTIKFEYMSNIGSVVVIPITHDRKILIEKNRRHSITKTLYELPAGHMEKGESAADAAARELAEETGYRAGKIRKIFSSYSSPGVSDEINHFCLATALKKGKANPEVDEDITVVFLSLDKALRMIKENKIKDTKTIAALLYYSKFLKGS
jgi:ADP-ribose pyrophosphatase